MWSQIALAKNTREGEIIREHVIHRARLTRVSSRIDNSTPKNMIHVKHNLKGKLIEQGKKDFINTSNKMLVDKLLKLNTRGSSCKNSKKQTIFLNRSKKIEEITKINNENYRVLHKIKTSKPYYSVERLKQEYKNSTQIKNRISRNSGRVPKILNYTQIEFNLGSPLFNNSTKNFNTIGRVIKHYEFLILQSQ